MSETTSTGVSEATAGSTATGEAMPRVLIVEDDDSMSVALRDGFGYEGYEVTLAHDGEEGYRL
ncbi:MAG TPA: hypothetical protein VKU40_18470, partial [Thermoanaerobaculia bacterium]|nr:hypothetical protein [Thermoanaerobaculia bacterium]